MSLDTFSFRGQLPRPEGAAGQQLEQTTPPLGTRRYVSRHCLAGRAGKATPSRPEFASRPDRVFPRGAASWWWRHVRCGEPVPSALHEIRPSAVLLSTQARFTTQTFAAAHQQCAICVLTSATADGRKRQRISGAGSINMPGKQRGTQTTFRRTRKERDETMATERVGKLGHARRVQRQRASDPSRSASRWTGYEE